MIAVVKKFTQVKNYNKDNINFTVQGFYFEAAVASENVVLALAVDQCMYGKPNVSYKTLMRLSGLVICRNTLSLKDTANVKTTVLR